MRSFYLIILLFMVSVVSSVQASLFSGQSPIKSADFFTVVMPYDDLDLVQTSAKNQVPLKNKGQVLDDLITQAMEVLLVRVTGQKSFLQSRVGKAYLQNPKAWLKTYDITPRMEEGVQVGKNIVFQFAQAKLKAEFSKRFVPIWPQSIRPKTLVMGSLVQGGTLVKLNQDAMRYRADVEFRHYSRQMALPIYLPNTSTNWVFPVDPSLTVSNIQETLARTDNDYLLSFKLTISHRSLPRLSWYLYANSGAVISSAEAKGEDQKILMQTMFDSVMAHYVQINSEKAFNVNQIVLNIHNVTQAEQVLAFERLLGSEHAMVKSFELGSMQADKIEFKIVTQSEYRTIRAWIQSWPQSMFIEDFPNSQQINIKINPTFFSQPSQGAQ